MTKYKPLLLTFFVLASLATLFPPFHWETEAGNPIPVGGGYEFPALPQKYAFLFGDSQQQIEASPIAIFPPGEAPRTFTFTRRLIVSELILEYVIAFFIALIIQVVVLRRKSPINQRT